MNTCPTQNLNLINMSFPFTWSHWVFNPAEGRECLWAYHQTLMASLHAMSRTNLAKAGDVRQKPDEIQLLFRAPYGNI